MEPQEVPSSRLPPLPTLPITSPETLRKCRKLQVCDKDIFICSFPKSGTTWMQNIVWQLLSQQKQRQQQSQKQEGTTDDEGQESSSPLLPFHHISHFAPFYEIDPHWESDSDQLIENIRIAHKALGHRIFNTHLLYDMLPTTTTTTTGQHQPTAAKFIYVVRDGRDVLTSFYHHLSNQHEEDGGFTGSFDDFFRQFLDGTIAYGKWTHHLASWIPRCRLGGDGDGDKNNMNNNILLVRYEDLKKDLEQQVSRIAKFLEIEEAIRTRDEYMEGVLEKVSFDWMRTNQELFHPISVRWKPNYNFIRNGKIGDYDNIFDEQHKQTFEEAIVKDFCSGGGGDGGGSEDPAVPAWFHEFCTSSSR